MTALCGRLPAAAVALAPRGSLAAALTGEPLQPSPEEARRWAAEELAKPAYGRSSVERFFAWLADQLSGLFQPAAPPGATPVPALFAVLAVLLLAGIMVLLVRAGHAKRTAKSADVEAHDAVFPEKPLAAAEYRRRARQALAAGDPSRAVIEGFRGIAAEMLERHILDESPDRTAREFATAAATAFPPFDGRLTAATNDFEATLYGGLSASARTAHHLLALDEELRQATPRLVDAAGLPAPLAVPR